jgi:hypothetical protein
MGVLEVVGISNRFLIIFILTYPLPLPPLPLYMLIV